MPKLNRSILVASLITLNFIGAPDFSIAHASSGDNRLISFDDFYMQDSFSGERIVSGGMADGSELILGGKVSHSPCSSMSLEAEIVQTARSFSGSPTVSSPATLICPANSGDCLKVPFNEAIFELPTGRSLKAQARVQQNVYMTYIEPGKPARCDTDSPPVVKHSEWRPFTYWTDRSSSADDSFLSNPIWIGKSIHPADSIIIKGSSTDELDATSAIDDKWYAIESSSAPPYEFLWVGTTNTIENIYATSGGSITLRSKSSKPCIQRIELFQPQGLRSSSYVFVDERTVGPTPTTTNIDIGKIFRKVLAKYISSDNSGRIEIKFSCKGKERFTHSIDSFSFTYESPLGVKRTD